MSKERLEEIAYNVGISIDGEKALMSSDDYDFLYNYALQQTERVQELEDELIVQKECFEELQNNHIRVCNQNKLYRETIEFAINHLCLVKEIGQVDMVINQMRDILEESE